DGFFLEYDDERSGTFEPLRFVPPGKMVVLGLVTTKSGALEDPDALNRRNDEASRYVPPDQLRRSPQRASSSTVAANTLPQSPQRLVRLCLLARVPSAVVSPLACAGIRTTAGGPPRGPKVSTTADTPALFAPATTTSTAPGELSAGTASGCPSACAWSGR